MTAVLCVGGVARADLIGTSVTGSVAFDGPFTNYLGPGSSATTSGYHTPLECENAAGPTVAVSATRLEFGFNELVNVDRADFGPSSLTIADTSWISGNYYPFTMTFTDPAFAGLRASKVDDTFTGGASVSLVGTRLTVSVPGERLSAGATSTATFSLMPAGTTAATPLPTSGVAGLSLLGLLGVARVGGRRRRPPLA